MPQTRRPLCFGFVAALGLLSAACRTPFDAPLPANAVLFTPPAQYRLWWDVTSMCSGISRSFDAVRWYIVPGVRSFRTDQGVELVGAYYTVNNRIVLAGAVINTGGVVRHEMLHAFIQAPGAHPAAYFQRRCAGIVDCADSCAAVVDPAAPDTAAMVVKPADASLDLQFFPADGRLSTTGGWYVSLASVTNRRSVPVRVALPNRGVGEYIGFGYADDCWTALNFTLSSSIDLAPGETRYEAFDHEWCLPDARPLTARASLGRDSTSFRHFLSQP